MGCTLATKLITVSHAREIVRSAAQTLGEERIPVAQALDRVLARDVLAAGDAPPFSCSAMDGYAVIPGRGGRDMSVVGESRAGAPSQHRVADGEAIRISTGAAVPAGATSVVRQEDVEERGSGTVTHIHTTSDVEPGANVRAAAEDLRRGTMVLAAGTVLGPAELGAAVTAGAGYVLTVRRPVVAVMCTGDELRAPGEALGRGEIHDCNAVMLSALVRRSGATVAQAARLRDDRPSTEAALSSALARIDVLIVSGGVSVGRHDHVRAALAALGVRALFSGVALQPGKPTFFGERDGKLIFGLPGNPVSAFVTFSLFASPALAALRGAKIEAMPQTRARLAVAVARKPGREQALRVRLEARGSALVAHPNGPQGSHLVSALLGANALALIPPGDGVLEAGSTIGLEPLPG
ncbi:MAG: molybdopterin molybdotransferase MoeA [Solirubrobacteraceae bacterium]